METKIVLVTGIGGNVGQGIIKNIRGTTYKIKIIGTNISDFSSGNHLVDCFYKVPFGFDPDYIRIIKDIIAVEKVDLIIPSTDYEAYFLSLNKMFLNCLIAVSEINVTEIYLDKYLTFLNHKESDISFAKSALPSQYKGEFEKALAKPRKGRGSKGLIFEEKEFYSLLDDEYLIQELHNGIEITSAIYRSYINDDILGAITMERSLENGATTYCRVIDTYDKEVLKIAEAMCFKNIGLKGSFNIQSIAKLTGDIIPFEVNCRISGTNSIRSSFGFKDVQYTIEELLFDVIPQSPEIIKGMAVRTLTDIIYPDSENVKGNNLDNYFLF